jgi:SIR2-like domain
VASTPSVCIVTFNYDTLLEDALQDLGFEIKQMSDYIAPGRIFKLFKIHGSINWGQVVKLQLHENTNLQVPQLVLSQLIERVAELEMTDAFHVCSPDSMGFYGGVAVFPAIAIPVEKKAQFLCPQTVLDELVLLLPRVDKILSIGWRGTEEHFLHLLRAHLASGIKLYSVAATEMEAVNFNRKLAAEIPQKFAYSQADPTPTGFTEFMRSLRVIPFLEG